MLYIMCPEFVLRRNLNDVQQKCKKVFNADQLKALQHRKRAACWSTSTVKKALQVRYACGARWYESLRQSGYPLIFTFKLPANGWDMLLTTASRREKMPRCFHIDWLLEPMSDTMARTRIPLSYCSSTSFSAISHCFKPGVQCAVGYQATTCFQLVRMPRTIKHKAWDAGTLQPV